MDNAFASGCEDFKDCHSGCPFIEVSGGRPQNFFEAPSNVMQIYGRDCGPDQQSYVDPSDLTMWKREMADLSSLAYGEAA